MTKVDAIDWINQLIVTMKEETSGDFPEPEYQDEVYEALEMGIEVLKQQSILDKIKAEIKEWYWQADKQVLAKDPCVVDAMIDLFIRTIDKYKAESEDKG